MHKNALYGLAVLTIVVGSGGAVAAAGVDLAPRSQPVNPAPALAVAPTGHRNLGAKHQTDPAALKAHLTLGDPEYLAHVDWSSAESFAVPGSQLRGWTFRSDNKTCLAIPDPSAEGYGVTCKTAAEIAAGEATVVMSPAATAGVPSLGGVLGDGKHRPTLKVPAGKAFAWAEVRSGVYAGSIPGGSRLETESGVQSVDPAPAEVVDEAPRP